MRWWERVEELTFEEALRHPDPRVRDAAALWQRVPPEAFRVHRQVAATLRRQRAWGNDPLRTLGRLLEEDDGRMRWNLARALVRRWPRLVPRRSPNPDVRRCLKEQADRRGWPATRDWLIEHIYPHAVLEVAARAEQPQRIRVGKTYLKDGAGRVVPRRPWQDTPA